MKLAAIAEALAYKGKPGWTPTDDAPTGMLGDRIQDEGQPKPQDIQALSHRAEQRIIAAYRAMDDLLRKTRQQQGHFQDLEGAATPVHDDGGEGGRYREDMTGHLWNIMGRVWKVPERMQEIRRRIGLSRNEQTLSDLYHTVQFMASSTYNYVLEANEGGEIDKFPELKPHFDAMATTLRELAETVLAVLRGTGMWKMDARHMGHTIRPNERTKPNAMKSNW